MATYLGSRRQRPGCGTLAPGRASLALGRPLAPPAPALVVIEHLDEHAADDRPGLESALLGVGDCSAGVARSIGAEYGFGGPPHGEDRDSTLRTRTLMGGHRGSERQREDARWVRWDRWRASCDSLGRSEPYDLEADLVQPLNLWDNPRHAGTRARIVEELLRWTLRTEDDLPAAKYQAKQADRGRYPPPG